MDTSVDEKHALGKVSVDEWGLDIQNSRGVNYYEEGELLNAISARKLDILYLSETQKNQCEITNIGKGGLTLWSEVFHDSHGSQGLI